MEYYKNNFINFDDHFVLVLLVLRCCVARVAEKVFCKNLSKSAMYIV